jgi:ferredoxin
MLTDVNIALRSDFSLMDAIVGMEGPGPGSGAPRKIGALLASRDPLALDRTACRIIGLDPALVANLEDALGRGVWIGSDEDIEIIGTNPNDIRIDDWKQVPRGSSGERRIPPALRNLFVGRPFFSKRTCIACGACVAICPEKALKLVPDAKGRAKQRIEVDYDKCIRCYCCHEVCPEDAIVVRRTKPLYDGPALSRGHRGQ